MSERIEAVYQGGVFHPQVPVSVPEGERVSLDVGSANTIPEDLLDVADLLDNEFIAACQRRNNGTPSLDEVRRGLSVVPGSLSDRIIAERDER
jgi:predicted DNA-binding antitoxin AbrB/MazE fold protein